MTTLGIVALVFVTALIFTAFTCIVYDAEKTAKLEREAATAIDQAIDLVS